MTTMWVSDTTRDSGGNHYTPAAGRIENEEWSMPRSAARADTPDCALVAPNRSTESERWSDPIPAQTCTIHSIADPTLADFAHDGTTAVIAATTERIVTAYHPHTSNVAFRQNLPSYGYTKPIVTVLDHESGAILDTYEREAAIYPHPRPADIDGGGDPEAFLRYAHGRVLAVEFN